jgi:hypothetical protein
VWIPAGDNANMPGDGAGREKEKEKEKEMVNHRPGVELR